VEAWLHVFLILTIDGDEWSISRPGSFISGVRAPGVYRIGDWVNRRADLNSVEKGMNFFIAPAQN
jgi:hypothetical protein